MYEAPEPPKKQAPYAWLVGGLAILSVCAMVMSVSNGTTATKNLDALVAAQAAAAKNAEALSAAQVAADSRERALQEQVDKLSAAVTYTDKSLKEAASRVNELAAELAKLRKTTEPKDTVADNAKTGNYRMLKVRLLAEAMRDWDAGKLQATKAKFEEILSIDSNDVGVKEGLASVNFQIAEQGNSWVRQNNEYLAKIDADKSVTKTASGLRYKIIEEGSAARPNAASTVKCRYEGKLIDGKVFDTTKARNNEPSEFPLNAVIPAWTEGVQKIGTGGKIILYCPSSLAYGSEGQGPIPGNSVLTFEVELVEVTKYR